MAQWVILYNQQKNVMGSSSTDLMFPLFSRKSKKEITLLRACALET